MNFSFVQSDQTDYVHKRSFVLELSISNINLESIKYPCFMSNQLSRYYKHEDRDDKGSEKKVYKTISGQSCTGQN